MNIGAIILAGGLSSRMGDLKPLLCLDNRTLLEHCTLLFQQTGVNRVLAVTGHREEEVAGAVQHLDLELVHNPHYHQGMLTSIQVGLRSLAPHNPDGCFILPVDIPLVRPPVISSLLASFSNKGDHTAIPFFNGKPGHPPILPASLIDAVLNYKGSGGLRALLNHHPCNPVQVWDQGILLDADTPADFVKMSRRYRRLGTPSKDETMALAKLLVPKEGQEHGRMVAKVAVILGKALIEKGFSIDEDLLFAGGWLHDLAKGLPNHGQYAATRLNALGLSPVSAVVANHRDLALDKAGHLDERHLVCLADKAVSGNRLVEPVYRYRATLLRFQHSPEAQQRIRNRMKNGLALQLKFEQVSGHRLLPLISGATH